MRKITMLLVLMLGILSAGWAAADTLTIPKDVKEIQEEAFFGDTNLDVVVLPDGIERIGDRAFADSSLQRIYLPASLTEISESAFSGCGNVVGYGSANTFASHYFQNHDGLTFQKERVTTSWNSFVFVSGEDSCWITGYTGTEINIVIPSMGPDGKKVTRINDGAFKGCNILRSVTLPSTLREIGAGAFLGCSSLRFVHIPNGVTTIGVDAFKGDPLETLTIPDTVQYIGDGAFSGGRFTRVELPEGLTTLGSWIGNSYSGLSRGAFQGCPLTEVVINSTGLTDFNAKFIFYKTGLKKLDVPVGVSVLRIPDDLAVIRIPESVNTIWDFEPNQSDASTCVRKRSLKVYAPEGSTAYTKALAIGLTVYPYESYNTSGPAAISGLPSGKLRMGEPFSFSGYYRLGDGASDDLRIESMTAEVTNLMGVVVNTKVLQINSIYAPYRLFTNTGIITELPLGKYVFSLFIQLSGHSSPMLAASSEFEIVSSVARAYCGRSTRIPSGVYPVGTAFEGSGEIIANRKIESVHVRAANTDGQVPRDYTIQPEKMRVSIPETFSSLCMDTLEAGEYDLTVDVTIEGTEGRLITSHFRLYEYDSAMDETMATAIVAWCSDPNNAEAWSGFKYDHYMEYLSGIGFLDQAAMVICNYSDIARDKLFGWLTGSDNDKFIVRLYKQAIFEMMQEMNDIEIADTSFNSFEEFVKKYGKYGTSVAKYTVGEIQQYFEEYKAYLKEAYNGEYFSVDSDQITELFYSSQMDYLKNMQKEFKRLSTDIKIAEYTQSAFEIIAKAQADYQIGLTQLAFLSSAYGNHPAPEFVSALREVMDEYQSSANIILYDTFDLIASAAEDKAIDCLTEGLLSLTEAMFHQLPGSGKLTYSLAKLSIDLVAKEALDLDELADDDFEFLTLVDLMLENRYAYRNAFDAVANGVTSSDKLMQVVVSFNAAKYSTSKIYEFLGKKASNTDDAAMYDRIRREVDTKAIPMP